MKLLPSTFCVLLFAFAAFGQVPADKCASDAAAANMLNVAVYDFVPDAASRPANLRELLRASKGFVETLESDLGLRVIDARTPVSLSDISLPTPEITGKIEPSPAQLGAKYYIVGKITKANDEFLLTVDLNDARDGSLISEQKLPFAVESRAEQTGRSAAAPMISSLSAQKLALRKKRDASEDVSLNPTISVVLDKERVKPNETAKVRITLTDCDGKPLVNRKVETTVTTEIAPPLSKGSVLPTDSTGAISDTVGATKPTVLRYLAVYRYKDLNGNSRSVADSRVLIVGEMSGYWIMHVDFYYHKNVYGKILNIPTPWNNYGREFDDVIGSVNVIFKAQMSADGVNAETPEVVTFDGFVGRTVLGDETKNGFGLLTRQFVASLDTNKDAIDAFQAGFRFDANEKRFSAGVGSLVLKGVYHQEYVKGFGHGEDFRDQFPPIDRPQESNIATELGGIGCESEAKPAMIQSGKFECSFNKFTNLGKTTDSEAIIGSTSLDIKATVQSLGSTNIKIIRK